MNGKKILSSICSFLILCNQIPFSFTTAFAEGTIATNTSEPIGEPPTEKIELTLPVDFSNNLSFSKVYDGTTIVADTDKDFSTVELVGILPEDANKVTLQAAAEYESMDAGDTNVIISDFRLLFSDDANEEIRRKYVFSFIEDISVPGKIERRKVCVNPSDDFRIVDNSLLPERVPYDVVEGCDEHTENYVLNEDENSLTNTEAILSVEKNEDGSLSFFFADGESIKTGNPNYEFVLHSDILVQPVAPEAMQVTSAIVSKKKATVLEQNDHGIYANGSVYVDIISESAEKYEDVKFQLSAKGEDLGYLTTFGYHENKKIETELTESELKKLETVTCEEVTKDENGKELENPIYRYTARFELGLVGDEKSADYSNLTCVIDNGTSFKTDNLNIKVGKKDETQNILIIDKNDPKIDDNMKIEYNNYDRYFRATGNIVDVDSGIKQIMYRWDFQNDWTNYPLPSNRHNASIYFESKINYDDSVMVNGNWKHTLHFEITDNAGNTYKTNGTYYDEDKDLGYDSKPPVVTYIKLDKTTDNPWKSIIRILSFGNFAKQKLVLNLRVMDVAESTQVSGVKSIELIDVDNKNLTVIHTINKEDIKEDKFVYEISLKPNLKIEDWYIRLTDNGGRDAIYSVKDLLQGKGLVKDTSNDVEAVTNENSESVTETTTTAIDWNALESNKWVFDDKAPTCDVKWAESSVYNEQTKFHYYNNTGGDFVIEISDENGLQDWSVVPTNKDGEVYTDINKSGIFDDEQRSTRYSIDTAALETGWYSFNVTATDNAGNTLDKNSAAFYVDHEEPSGRIEVLSPSLETFTKKENWIRERVDGKIAAIKMRLYIETKGSALNAATITVNGGKKTFTFHESDIVTDESTGEMYIDFEFTPDEKSDPNGLSYNDDHTYDISADIITYSGNSCRADYKLHVDTDTPTVDTFTVEKTNSTTENILNILTFGVFFKDSLTLTVKVSDAEYDSGIDRVEIQYAGLSKAIEMKSVGDGKFTYELPWKTDVFQSEITITVYDNTGKVNTSCPDIQNTEGDRKTKDNHFVMIETVAPLLVVDLPETDSTIRSDGQIWYRQHSNTEKDVEPADSEKMITVSVQDENSGLRYVQMLVNGKDVVENSQDLEQSGIALPTIISTEQAENRINDNLIFQYSIEKIAEFAQANEDGSYIIEFRVVDNAGNATTLPVNSSGTEYKDGKIIYYRDTVSPTITQFSFNPTTADEIVDTDQFIDELEYGFYFKKDFTATVTVDDAAPSSGYDRVVFRLVPYANGAMQEPEEYIEKITDGNQVSYTVRAGFKGQIYATTYDKVNNKSEEKTPQAFVSDENAPTITIEPLSETSSGTDNNGNKLFTGQVQFKVTISDTESGLRTISYFKESEKDSFDSIVTEIGNLDGKNPDIIANGWQITGTDENLVTEVSQIFTFDID
ncbi:MAG: Ig-like domain repeat protein, partial [Ruminococcus sp.]|nr:Ig-like domain repeat protein [Ruminococcus sp.]